MRKALALERGTFRNGIPHLRFGAGPRRLLFLSGGPGNQLPDGLGALAIAFALRPFCDEYTVDVVTRKSGLPEGYTTQDMAGDYAELIRQEFGGHVDLVIGMSYGGLIAQHFAADYAELFGHLVIAMAAHKVSEADRRIDFRYAELTSKGQDREAMAQRAEEIFPAGPLKPLLAAALWAVGKPLLGSAGDTFRKDVLIEAKAELAHESTSSLKRITVPVLIAGGRNDFAFPVSAVQEMAALIANSTLKIYPGGHFTAILDRRFAQDVREFTRQPRATT